jgi:hypothetical protein
MRACPFNDCGMPIADHIFACRRHWHGLNPQQKRIIHSAYADYLSDKIDVEELRAIQQRVLNAVQGLFGSK